MIRLLASSSRGCAIILAAIIVAAQQAQSQSQSSATERATADTAFAVHLLNRLTFGPRPGEVAQLLRQGTEKWIAQQLRGDTALDELTLKSLAGCELFTEPVDIAINRLSGRENFEMIRADGTTGTAGIGFGGVSVVTRDSARKIRGSPALGLYLANGQLHSCRLARVERSEAQLLEVMTDFWANHFSVFSYSLPVRGSFIEYDRKIIRPNALGKFRDLLGAVAHSPAMLTYLDNAVNSADSTRQSLSTYQLPAGPVNFRDTQIKRPGLNENYARELLELHTMGVDGGYTQHDVIEVARAMTGWSHSGALPGADEITRAVAMMSRSLRGQPMSLSFVFDPGRHDAEEKTVLGRTLPAGRGIEDGEEVLDMLARHPSTARHIARKLAVRFVADEPPETLISTLAETFLRTEGNIREVMRALIASPEFRSPEVYGGKVKSPQEFVLSLRRALAAPPDAGAEVIDLLVRLDQPPFGRASPDGWPETASPWMTVGAMSTRIDIAVQAGRDSLPSIPVRNWPAWQSLALLTFDVQLQGVVHSLLNGKVSAATRSAMESLRPAAPGDTAGRQRVLMELIAMALSSPEFQRR